MNQIEKESAIKHAVQLLLNQIVETNKHIDSVKNKTELEEADKNAIVNFSGFHLMVLSILMHDLKHITLEMFPDAAQIVEWSESNYKYCLDNKMFKPCTCKECEI